MKMQWTDFQPYVMPYVIGCSEPLMVHHARLASIEFCRRTLCWQKTLDVELSDGSESVDLCPDGGTQIIKIKSVVVGGRAWPMVSDIHGLELARSDTGKEFAFTRDDSTIHVYPAQASGTTVTVDAVLAPDLKATYLDDALALYVPDIAHGVIASLQMVPGQTFTNPEFSRSQLANFYSAITTEAARVSRGRMAIKMRGKAQYI